MSFFRWIKYLFCANLFINYKKDDEGLISGPLVRNYPGNGVLDVFRN